MIYTVLIYTTYSGCIRPTVRKKAKKPTLRVLTLPHAPRCGYLPFPPSFSEQIRRIGKVSPAQAQWGGVQKVQQWKTMVWRGVCAPPRGQCLVDAFAGAHKVIQLLLRPSYSLARAITTCHDVTNSKSNVTLAARRPCMWLQREQDTRVAARGCTRLAHPRLASSRSICKVSTFAYCSAIALATRHSGTSGCTSSRV